MEYFLGTKLFEKFAKSTAIANIISNTDAVALNSLAEIVTEFPKVVVRFVKGSELVNNYPTCKVKYNQREEFLEVIIKTVTEIVDNFEPKKESESS